MARDSFERLLDSTVICCLSTKHVLQMSKTCGIRRENVHYGTEAMSYLFF